MVDLAPAAEMAPSEPTMKYENSAFEPEDPLAMYLEKSGTLFLGSPLKGLSKVDDASRRAGVELTARTAVVGRRAELAAAVADRARARDMVCSGAIACDFLSGV